MLNYTNQIIELAKKTKNLNISPFAFAFRWCNNDCNFCYLKDYMLQKPLTLESIKDINNSVIIWLNDHISEIPKDVNIQITLIGGELFCCDDKYYNEYNYLIEKLKSIIETNGNLITYTFFSNLLYDKDKLDNLIKLSKKYNSNIVTSFDTLDRFKNENALNNWYTNISIIKENNINLTIGMILSKKSIYKLINIDDIYTKTYYKLLNEKWNIDYDIFIPNSDINYENIPTQQDLINFYKHIIDKYWGNLPNNPIFNYQEVDDIIDYPIYINCAKLMFLPSTEINPKINLMRGEYNIAELYCNDMCRFNTLQNTKKKILKDNHKKEFICIADKKQVEYYYDNILKCNICKMRGYCNKEKLRDCYIDKRYFIWNDTCWVKQVLLYLKKKYENKDDRK